MTRTLLLLLLLAPGALAQQAAAPSFDCARAQAWDERAICADRDLAALDRRVAEAFRRAVEATPVQRDRLQAEQRAWIRERRACDKPASGTPQGCLRRVMAARATALEAGLQQNLAPPPQGTASAAAQPPVAAGPALRPVDCGNAQGWAAQRICADPQLRRMDEAIARHVATVRQRLAAQPGPLREFEAALAAHLRQRAECARPVGRVPEDCIIETLEDAERDWGRMAAAQAQPPRR
ncbi:MAG TPA: lysozyme inhibitor LprI family protein [Acetobacteraceae bacterium]|nr:lysozyme inhibitor LprI family protein [Acetobacteraceae bacterium]